MNGRGGGEIFFANLYSFTKDLSEILFQLHFKENASQLNKKLCVKSYIKKNCDKE